MIGRQPSAMKGRLPDTMVGLEQEPNTTKGRQP